MSHKSWMKTVPTENCDVLMTFAGQAFKHTPVSVVSSHLCGPSLVKHEKMKKYPLSTYIH